jgi:prophage DNA circulation protein
MRAEGLRQGADMRDVWALNMSKCKWRNIELEIRSLGDNLERRWVEHEYPGVDGADVEDTGRRPRDTRITAVFHGADYLTDLSNLIGLVADGKAGVFQHPFLGTYQARVTIGTIDHHESMRNGCLVELAVKESKAGGDIEPILTIQAYKVEVTTWVDAVEDASDDLEDALAEVEGAIDAITDAIDGARDLVDNIQARAASVVQNMNTCIRKIDKAVKKARDLGDVDSYPLVRALNRTSNSAQALGRRALGTKWPLRARSVPVPVPAALLAHQLYGDRTRADELAELNSDSIYNPSVIPAGTTLKVFNK